VCRVGTGEAKRWEDFEDLIPKHRVRKLRSVYSSVDDVDLFVGGFMEVAKGDAIVGPTFKCILGDQFAR